MIGVYRNNSRGSAWRLEEVNKKKKIEKYVITTLYDNITGVRNYHYYGLDSRGEYFT